VHVQPCPRRGSLTVLHCCRNQWDSPGSRGFGFSTHAQGPQTPPCPTCTCPFREPAMLAFPLSVTRSHTEKRFGAQSLAFALPPVTALSHDVVTASRHLRRKPKSMLLVLRKKLSFSIQKPVLSRHTRPNGVDLRFVRRFHARGGRHPFARLGRACFHLWILD